MLGELRRSYAGSRSSIENGSYYIPFCVCLCVYNSVQYRCDTNHTTTPEHRQMRRASTRTAHTLRPTKPAVCRAMCVCIVVSEFRVCLFLVHSALRSITCELRSSACVCTHANVTGFQQVLPSQPREHTNCTDKTQANAHSHAPDPTTNAPHITSGDPEYGAQRKHSHTQHMLHSVYVRPTKRTHAVKLSCHRKTACCFSSNMHAENTVKTL